MALPSLADPVGLIAPAGFTPTLPALDRELGERYIGWLNVEMIAMQHHLGINERFIPRDRMVGLWMRTPQAKEKIERRAVGFMWAAGVSVKPDPDSLVRRYGGGY